MILSLNTTTKLIDLCVILKVMLDDFNMDSVLCLYKQLESRKQNNETALHITTKMSLTRAY
jgi:hypothetical protein